MWCCFEPGAETRVLELGVVADLRAPPDDAARPQVAERPDGRVVLDRPTPRRCSPRPRRPRPIVASMSWLPAPMTLPVPTLVAPRRITFGSSVTSAARSTRPVEVDRRRVAHRHAGPHVRLVEPDPQAPLAAASCDRSLMPSNRPSSSNATAATIRPSSRASRMSSVRYSSPVAADGSGRDARRSQAASNAYSPALISFVELLGRRVLGLDDPLDASRTRHARPGRARPGRRRRRWRARSPRRPRGGPRARVEVAPRSTSGTSPYRTRISVGVLGDARKGGRTASPVPRGSSWSANIGRSAKTSHDCRDGRRVDDDRSPARPRRQPCSPRRRGCRPASAARTWISERLRRELGGDWTGRNASPDRRRTSTGGLGESDRAVREADSTGRSCSGNRGIHAHGEAALDRVPTLW